MTNPAKNAIEEAYSTTLNPELDYLSQLQSLARNGELASHLTSNQVLFKLCMIVDRQGKEIESLKEDRASIAKQIVELKESKVDPTSPLG